jgi:protocatechuate 3,4-dioxygenase alpha subunit
VTSPAIPGGRAESRPHTPGQTVGPFFGYALPWEAGGELVLPSHPDAVHLHGTVYDGAGDPVPDALIEIWQTDATGKTPQAEGSRNRDGWTFTGFGRAATDDGGGYTFTTVRPATGFISMTVFARGLLDRLFTRVYLPDPETGVADDAFLESVPAERRSTLVAECGDDDLVFDIHLQGERETVFLDFGA